MNIEQIIITYIKPELIVLIPVLYLIGLALKKAAFVNDKFIPLVLGVIGIVVVFLYLISVEGWSVSLIAVSLIQGVLASAGAVYFNQIWKQLGK